MTPIQREGAPVKILVCGGRDYTDRHHLYKILDEIHREMKVTSVVHGASRGADTLGEDWANDRWIATHPMPALWSEHGRRAGPIRNAAMLAAHPEIELVVAFPGGRGTDDMIQRAEAAGLTILRVNPLA